jgi:hypothetical protein
VREVKGREMDYHGENGARKGGSRRGRTVTDRVGTNGDLCHLPPVVKESTSIDCGHHCPFSFFRSFYAKMFKKSGESGGEIIEFVISMP